MSSIRRRPLTWLFFIATACVTLVALRTGFELPWVGSLVMGQTYIVAGWLVLGKSHRLLRGAMFVAAILLLASPDYFRGNRAGEWNYVLGTLVTAGGATAAATACCELLRHWFSRTPPTPASKKWQFPVVELLGWMIVTAIASSVARLVVFQHVVESPLLLGVILAGAATASLIMTTFLPVERKVTAIGLLVVALALLAALVVLPHFLATRTAANHIASFLFVALWTLVQRLDHRLAGQSPTPVRLPRLAELKADEE